MKIRYELLQPFDSAGLHSDNPRYDGKPVVFKSTLTATVEGVDYHATIVNSPPEYNRLGLFLMKDFVSKSLRLDVMKKIEKALFP